MDINEILEDFNDINFYYNDCTKHDLLRRDLECYHSDRIEELEEEIKEARGRLRAIEDITRKAFDNPETQDINLYRAQTLANIFAIFEYNGETIRETAPQKEDDQITIEEVLRNENDQE